MIKNKLLLLITLSALSNWTLASVLKASTDQTWTDGTDYYHYSDPEVEKEVQNYYESITIDIISLMKGLAHHLESSITAYYVSGQKNIYVDSKELMKDLRARRELEKVSWGENSYLYDQLVPFNALPLFTCGLTSALLSSVFLSTEDQVFDWNTEQKTENIIELKDRIKLFPQFYSLFLRIETTNHSYVMVRINHQWYLFQSNDADQLSKFSFHDWVSKKDSFQKIKNIEEHLSILGQAIDLKTVLPKTELSRKIASTFSIDESEDINKPFLVNKFEAVLYPVDLSQFNKNYNYLMNIK